MISAQLEILSEDSGAFADGLRAWLSGDISCEAEAAGIVCAETILLHRALLRELGRR